MILKWKPLHWHSSYRPNLHLRQLECNNICPHFNVACEWPHGDTNHCWKCSGVVRIYYWWMQSKDDIRKEMIKINWCKSRLSKNWWVHLHLLHSFNDASEMLFLLSMRCWFFWQSHHGKNKRQRPSYLELLVILKVSVF